MNEQVVEAVVLTLILAIPGWEILKYVMKALMFYTLHRIKEEAELPTKINPSDPPIVEVDETKPVLTGMDFMIRAKQHREAIFGQELPPKYSIEPHGQPGEYALYFGRDMHHHGANLCKLSEFDAKGEESRKMIVAALNEKYTEKY